MLASICQTIRYHITEEHILNHLKTATKTIAFLIPILLRRTNVYTSGQCYNGELKFQFRLQLHSVVQHVPAYGKAVFLKMCPYYEIQQHKSYFSTDSHVISEDAFIWKFSGTELL
jgi:hypothetical protein